MINIIIIREIFVIVHNGLIMKVLGGSINLQGVNNNYNKFCTRRKDVSWTRTHVKPTDKNGMLTKEMIQ